MVDKGKYKLQINVSLHMYVKYSAGFVTYSLIDKIPRSDLQTGSLQRMHTARGTDLFLRL